MEKKKGGEDSLRAGLLLLLAEESVERDVGDLDDLETERNTEFVNEVTFEVIDGQYRAGKPLIITTNLTRKDMISAPDITKKRIYSRILEKCYPVEVNGNDRRKISLASDYAEMKKLLEG